MIIYQTISIKIFIFVDKEGTNNIFVHFFEKFYRQSVILMDNYLFSLQTQSRLEIRSSRYFSKVKQFSIIPMNRMHGYVSSANKEEPFYHFMWCRTIKIIYSNYFLVFLFVRFTNKVIESVITDRNLFCRRILFGSIRQSFR